MAHHHEKFQSFSSPGLNATSFCYLDCTPTTCTLLCNPPLGPFFPPPFPPPPPPPPPSPPCPPPPISIKKLAETHHLSPIVIVIVAVLTSAFLLISYYAIVKKYFSSNRRSNNPSGGGGPAAPILTNNNTHGDLDQTPNPLDLIWYVRTVGLDESVIKSITVCKYKRGEGLVEGTECSVCLNEFREDEDLRLLPKCSHAFHVPCIDTWLKSHVNCPLCRANVVANTMISPVNDPSLVSSDSVQEPQEVNSQNHIELGVNMSNGAVGNQGLGDVDRAELGDLGPARVNCGFRAQSDLIDNRRFGDCTIEMMDDDVQQVRRSVSMDSLASAMIAISMANLTSVDSEGSSTAIGAHSTGAKNSNLGESSDLKRIIPKHVWNQGLLKAVGNYSKRSFLQKGPILMKRSFSGGGKFFLARNGRSRNAVLPL